MRSLFTLGSAFAAVGLLQSLVNAQGDSWRYYRPGNTGIQGDYNEVLWIGADGDPWIGGFDASFEEGGFAKFVQSENRWINFSNVDYPVIGHPNATGTSRVSDITADANGVLWMATGHGALRFDPDVGASSLVRFDEHNSDLGGGWTIDVELAPDGSLWFAGYSTVWGDGSLARFDPSTSTWSSWTPQATLLSAQPKPGGGYFVWNGENTTGLVWRFDSTTQAWTQLPNTGAIGEVVGLPGKDCTDDFGNFWALRSAGPGNPPTLAYRRLDGTWVPVSAPFISDTNSAWVFRAFGDRQALVVDGGSRTWRFSGGAWTDLGVWRPGPWTYAADIDAAGNVWVAGTGGAAKRDVATGTWQRYRVTNTSQFDGFNNDLAIDPAGGIYACANAGSGYGGMVRFDGSRWIGFDNFEYGLGVPWPFPTDNSEAVYVRPSNGHVVVNPMFNSTYEWDGSQWSPLGGGSTVVGYTEDSLGRLWKLGEYFSLDYHDAGAWHPVGITAWGAKIQPDPDRPGTIWASTGHEIKRTDGVYSFSRGIQDFPALTTQSDTFSGLAVGRNGIAWVGATVMLGAGGSGGALIRIDANTGTHQMLRYDQGWPFPGQFVQPLAVTHDGRVWMQYDSDFLTAQRGLCWYDGVNVGVYPAPPGGEPQWGGVPHAGIADLEVRDTAFGYELWMSCLSRGIAVLSIHEGAPGTIVCTGDGSGSACPCGNEAASGSLSGCRNSTGAGATLRASGTAATSADDLVLESANLPPNKSGIVFMGANVNGGTPFSSGLLCIASPSRRFAVANAGPNGSFQHGPGLIGYAESHFAPTFHLVAGSNWKFQTWFRDPNGACAGKDSNTSNALAIDFLP